MMLSPSKMSRVAFACVALFLAVPACAAAQQRTPPTPTPLGPATVPQQATSVPADYMIGVNDVLEIVFWRDDSMSREVIVRPDGRISLPLLNDVEVLGLTPDQLRVKLTEVATRVVVDPSVHVVVKQINSRVVYVDGEIAKRGPINLVGEMRVSQLISLAGGLSEWAKKDRITIIRLENGREIRFRFNHEDYMKGKNPQQNILLKPGDTIYVP